MFRLAFDFIITWRETRTRPNAYAEVARFAQVLPVIVGEFVFLVLI